MGDTAVRAAPEGPTPAGSLAASASFPPRYGSGVMAAESVGESMAAAGVRCFDEVEGVTWMEGCQEGDGDDDGDDDDGDDDIPEGDDDND